MPDLLHGDPGTIPHELGRLTQLQRLDLSKNKLEGEFAKIIRGEPSQTHLPRWNGSLHSVTAAYPIMSRRFFTVNPWSLCPSSEPEPKSDSYQLSHLT